MPFRLYTHCGFDWRLDFDESFWQMYAGPLPQGTRTNDPIQRGTLTLLTDEVAVFRFDVRTGEASVYFVRNDTPKHEVSCF